MRLFYTSVFYRMKLHIAQIVFILRMVCQMYILFSVSFIQFFQNFDDSIWFDIGHSNNNRNNNNNYNKRQQELLFAYRALNAIVFVKFMKLLPLSASKYILRLFLACHNQISVFKHFLFLRYGQR